MLNIINAFLDLVFPPRESELIVRKLTAESISSLYIPGEKERVKYLSRYQNPVVRALITENKYFGNDLATKGLAQLLEIHLKHTSNCILIPIPLHPKREKERGYNQVTVVLQKSDCPVERNLLKRVKNTITQTSLEKSDRLKNMQDAFLVDVTAMQKYKDINFILIDDVLTTGATMEAARAVLAMNLNPTNTLTCLALAH